VIAGNSLFHVVVDTDEIASKIIHYLNADKGGRVSFLPLNRLGGYDPKMPESADAVPLLDYLQFSAQYTPAFKQVFLAPCAHSSDLNQTRLPCSGQRACPHAQLGILRRGSQAASGIPPAALRLAPLTHAQVFGRVLLCREFDVATTMARSTNLDCITMDGDHVSNRGALKVREQRRGCTPTPTQMGALSLPGNNDQESRRRLREHPNDPCCELYLILRHGAVRDACLRWVWGDAQGGYHDAGSSRIAYMRAIRALAAKVRTVRWLFK
jgi:hypothetical protein